MARRQRVRSVRPMFQTILIGYDGAERGGEAAALADALRDPHTGTLLLTSAYPLIPPPAAEETVEMLAQARDGLRKPDRVRIRAVASESAGRALSEMAETEDAALVVVGAGHRSALGRPLPGTAAERLLGEPPCPVAVAPRGYSSG